MTPTQLRAWLLSAPGHGLQFINSPHIQPHGQLERAPDNACFRRFFSVSLAQNGQNVVITRISSTSAQHGVFVPYIALGCPSVDLTEEGARIAISGPFTGCTFARADADGNEVVGHVYVDTNLDDNDPELQARNLERFSGSYQIGSAMGFATAGRVLAPAHEGYVFGVSVGQAWEWFWLTLTPAGTVNSCVLIPEADWVVL
jgi:hypothetical protein